MEIQFPKPVPPNPKTGDPSGVAAPGRILHLSTESSGVVNDLADLTMVQSSGFRV